MANPTPKTKISFPTFVRLDIVSRNLTEDKKKQALVIEESVSAENTQISGDLEITAGGMNCQENLEVKGVIDVSPKTSSSMDFRGRLNLANSPLHYKSSATVLRTDYANINDRSDQQYVPFGEFKRSRILYTERSATSAGRQGSGDFARGAHIPWKKFDEQSFNDTGAVTINDGELKFTASPAEPKLFRISVFMTKDGRWVDNGTGGECTLAVKMGGVDKTLAISTCSGSSHKRGRPMVWFCSTLYTTMDGYFFLRNDGGTFRVRFFSWNVTVLPYIP